jgi:predicted RNase H-like HicB family nuclease
MFIEYVHKAMHLARYEIMENGEFWGEIPGFQGVWGSAPTLEACRDDLQGALEGWLILGLWNQDPDIPVLGRLSLIPRRRRVSSSRGSAPLPRNRKAS